MINEKLLEILACPKCKEEIIYTGDSFICENCKLLFKIEDDIPNFLIDEAKQLSNEELREILQKLKNKNC